MAVQKRRLTAAAFVLVFTCYAVFQTMSYMLVTIMPSEMSVDPRQLFESLAMTVVEAGHAIVALNASSRAVEVTRGKFRDGSPDVHTAADAISTAVLSRLRSAADGLSVIDEDAVSASVAGRGQLRLHPTRAGRGSSKSARLGEQGNPALAALKRQSLPVSELAIYIDPLDGSTDLSEGRTEFVTVSACVTRCGRPIVGIVYQPFENRLYWTRPGTGIFVNFDAETAVMTERAVGPSWDLPDVDHAICCPVRKPGHHGSQEEEQAEETPLDFQGARDALQSGFKVVTSRKHSTNDAVSMAAKTMAEGLRTGATGAHNVPDPTILPVGGAGYKALQLIEHRAQVYGHAGELRKWDTCAGEALLRAAGGTWTEWASDRPVDYCVRPLKGPGSVDFDMHRMGGPAAGEALSSHSSPLLDAFTVRGVLASDVPPLHQAMLAAAKVVEAQAQQQAA